MARWVGSWKEGSGTRRCVRASRLVPFAVPPVTRASPPPPPPLSPSQVKYAVNVETGELVAIKILDKVKLQQVGMGPAVKREVRWGEKGKPGVPHSGFATHPPYIAALPPPSSPHHPHPTPRPRLRS